MAISIRQQVRERKAVEEHDCPLSMCNALKGSPCYSPRVWRRSGGYTKQRPRLHPHKERCDLVPDWTAGMRSYEEYMRDQATVPHPPS